VAALVLDISTFRGSFRDHQVPRRTKNDLPRHVLGEAWWAASPDFPLIQGYCLGEPPHHSPIEFLRIRNEDRWYELKRNRGPNSPEDDFWVTSSDLRVPIENKFGLGYWHKSDPQHPLYESYRQEQEQSAAEPQGEPIPVEEEELLAGALHHIVTTKGKQPLEPRPQIILPALSRHASEGHQIPTNIQPLAEQEPTRAEMSAQVAATTTASGSGTTTHQSNGGPLLGYPPAPFNGDRTESKEFLAKFEGWALLNYDKEVFILPFKKSALFLTYLVGPNLADWTEHRRTILTNYTAGTTANAWTELRQAFVEAYKDTGEQVVGLNKLENLKMIGGNIDDYIATFNRLIVTAGFTVGDNGIINMFRKGLNPSLLRQCIMHPSKKLASLQDWQDEARTKQLAWWEAQQATGTGMSAKKQQLYQKLRITGTRSNNNAQTRRDPDAMDIDGTRTKPDKPVEQTQTAQMDTIRTGQDGRPLFSDRQREALRVLGGCFRCGGLEHISKDCKKYPPPARPPGVTGSFGNRGRGWRGRGGGPPGPPRVSRQETRQMTMEEIPKEERYKMFTEMMMDMEPDKRADFMEEFMGPDF
jgi:Retrotransposon gag protein/Zinc knuckle